MTRKERKLYLRSLVGSRMSDLLTDMELSDKISPAESRMLTRRLSQVLDMKDMLPRPLEQPTTEEALRLARHLHLIKKVKIPGPKPGDTTVKAVVTADNVVQLQTPERKKFGNLVRKRA